MAETIKAALDETITLEECLNRIADIFSDSEEQFQRAERGRDTRQLHQRNADACRDPIVYLEV